MNRNINKIRNPTNRNKRTYMMIGIGIFSIVIIIIAVVVSSRRRRLKNELPPRFVIQPSKSIDNVNVLTTILPSPARPFTLSPENLNFNNPVVGTNSFQIVFSSSSATMFPISGWNFSSSAVLKPISTLTAQPTTLSGGIMVGNGTGGGYTFANINTVSSVFTQFAIMHFASSVFDGTYQLTMSYDIGLPSKGAYVLTYFVQARPMLKTKIKYVENHTIKASIHTSETKKYSFGSSSTSWGVWKQQQLNFDVPSPGLYTLKFISNLNDYTGAADSAVAVGAITIQAL